MSLKTFIVKQAAKAITKNLQKQAEHAVEYQEKTMQKLVKEGQNTLFGHDHGFEKIKDYCDIHFPITPKERLMYMTQSSKRAFEIKFRYPWIGKVNSEQLKIIY